MFGTILLAVDGSPHAKRHGQELEQSGVPVKVDLIRTLAGRVAAWPTRSSIWPTVLS